MGDKMRIFLTVLALTLFASCSSEAQTLSKEAYRDLIAGSIEKAHPELNAVAQGELALDIVLARQQDATPSRMFLDTGYSEYLAAPEQLGSIVAKWTATVAVISDDTAPTADVRSQIVSLVRPRGYLDVQKQTGAQAAAQPDVMWRPFGGDMIAVLMVNSATTLRSLSREEVTALGMSADEAWAIAAINLKAEMGALNIGDMNGDGPVTYSAESGLATGLLLTPDACTPQGGSFKGQVILVLDRNAFIATLPKDSISVKRFWAFAKPFLGTRRLASDTPLTCVSGAWQPAKIPN